MAIQSYPDPRNPGAKLCFNDQTAWRRYPDGREEDLTSEEEAAVFERLHKENERGRVRRRAK